MSKNAKNSLRGQILRAARRLLVKDGIQNISMRKIAAEIGCKAPSIYYHFRNKDQLIHTLIDEGHQRLYNFLLEEQQLLGDDANILTKVETNIRAFVKFGLENSEYYEIMYLAHSEEINRYPLESFRKTRQALDFSASLYREAMETGFMEHSDPKLMATTVTTMLNGFITSVLMRRLDTEYEMEQLKNDFLNRVLRSVSIKTNQEQEDLASIS